MPRRTVWIPLCTKLNLAMHHEHGRTALLGSPSIPTAIANPWLPWRLLAPEKWRAPNNLQTHWNESGLRVSQSRRIGYRAFVQLFNSSVEHPPKRLSCYNPLRLMSWVSRDTSILRTFGGKPISL